MAKYRRDSGRVTTAAQLLGAAAGVGAMYYGINPYMNLFKDIWYGVGLGGVTGGWSVLASYSALCAPSLVLAVCAGCAADSIMNKQSPLEKSLNCALGKDWNVLARPSRNIVVSNNYELKKNLQLSINVKIDRSFARLGRYESQEVTRWPLPGTGRLIPVTDTETSLVRDQKQSYQEMSPAKRQLVDLIKAYVDGDRPLPNGERPSIRLASGLGINSSGDPVFNQPSGLEAKIERPQNRARSFNPEH